MAGVRVKENEPIESAIRRFKKQCEKAGILQELKKREHYEKPSVRRKRKAVAARKRAFASGQPFVLLSLTAPPRPCRVSPHPPEPGWVFCFTQDSCHTAP